MSNHGVIERVIERMALAVEKSEKPKWDKPFHTSKRLVTIWAESLKVEHLLAGLPLGDVSEFEYHDAARCITLLSLSAAHTDTAYTTYLFEAWIFVLDRHEPSRAVEVSRLYHKLTSPAQNGRPMGEHVKHCRHGESVQRQ